MKPPPNTRPRITAAGEPRHTGSPGPQAEKHTAGSKVAHGAISRSDVSTVEGLTSASEPSAQEKGVAKTPAGDLGLTRFMRVTPRQMRCLSDWLSSLKTPFPLAMRDFFLHVLYCQTRYRHRYEDGVPVPASKIRMLEDAPRKTENVWRPLVDRGLLTVREYEEGLCRRFLINHALLFLFARAGADDHGAGIKKRLDPFGGSPNRPFSGKRTRSRYKTLVTRDGSHSWPDLLDQVLRYYRDSRALIDLPAYRAFVDRLEDVAAHARKRARAHPMSRTLEKQARRAEAAWAHENRILLNIMDLGPVQALDMPAGIYQYKPAYEPQTISGRLSMKGGGAQNASAAGKAAMYDRIPNLYNWDIKSSQTAKLIEEFEDANVAGAGLDISVLTEYLGKDVLAKRHGVSREVFKRAEHAPKFGAGFTFKTFASAKKSAEREAAHDRRRGRTYDLTWQEHVRSKLHTMPKIALEIAEDPSIEISDVEGAYRLLRKVYGPMAKEIAQWRDWLVTEHWARHNQPGGSHGRFVVNPCGLAFSIHAYDEREQGSKYATSRLQGGEAAFVHQLTLLGSQYGYEVIGNEHDGLLTLGLIPQEAVEEARVLSGFRTAELERKGFKKAPVATLAHSAMTTSKNVPRVLGTYEGRVLVMGNVLTLSRRMHHRPPRRLTRTTPSLSWTHPVAARTHSSD